MRLYPKFVSWAEVRKDILEGIKDEHDKFAIIKPFEHEDVAVTISPYYSILSINGKNYYFIKETGEFDGTLFDIV